MIGGESISTIRMGVVILFFVATVWFALIGLALSREASNEAADELERALEHNTEYVLDYLAAGEQIVPVAEAYALYCYNEDIISSCECGFHSPAQTAGSVEDCCLRDHLNGKCKVSLVNDGRGGYKMIVRKAD